MATFIRNQGGLLFFAAALPIVLVGCDRGDFESVTPPAQVEAAVISDDTATALADNPSAEDRDIRDSILAMVAGPEEVMLKDAIPALTGYRVLDWDDEHRDLIAAATREAANRVNAAEVTATRINEVGLAMEEFVIAALNEAGFVADIPTTQAGHRRSVGYPDIQADLGDTRFYIEMKVHGPRTEDSSQRSFYLSDSDDPKITRDAFHLLIAFESVKGPSGYYTVEEIKILDLHTLNLNIKNEFNASNRDLYDDESGLVVIREKTGEALETAGGDR